MDTSDLDTQARQHLNVYKGFMTFSMVSVAVVAVVLVLMALFLL
ncbi:MAG: aa3-type cytochrome c oxidase subunit IV [Candidatus Puniceispirillales bacterium]